MFGAFGNYSFVAHGGDLRGKVVAVYQLGVAEYFRANSEQLKNFVVVGFNLCGKFFRLCKRCKRVGVCFGKEFHFAGVCQFFQKVDEFRHIVFALFECHSGDRQGATECAVALLNHSQQAFGCRYVAVVGYSCDYVVIGKVVIVVMVVAYVEESVSFVPERLVNLKIKTNCFHDVSLVNVFLMFDFVLFCGQFL